MFPRRWRFTLIVKIVTSDKLTRRTHEGSAGFLLPDRTSGKPNKLFNLRVLQ